MKSLLKLIYEDLSLITVLVMMGLLLYVAFRFTTVAQPMATGPGNCGTDWIAKVDGSPFNYSGDVPICKVIIKAGSAQQGDACTGFTFPPASQSNTCYQVSGLGSTSIRATKIGSGPECKDISHIEVYACPNTPTTPPTSPPTSTNTPEVPTETPSQSPSPSPTFTITLPPSETPTSTPGTPWKFWTPTPGTPTPFITQTPTGTSGPSVTPTFPVTSTPGKGKKPTPTPLKELPQTGFAEDYPVLLYGSLGLLLAAVVALSRYARKRL